MDEFNTQDSTMQHHGDGYGKINTRINDLHSILKFTLPIITAGLSVSVVIALGILAYIMNVRFESEKEKIHGVIESQRKLIDEKLLYQEKIIDDRLGKLTKNPTLEFYLSKDKTPLQNSVVDPELYIDNNEMWMKIYFIVKNVGNGIAREFLIKLYTNPPLKLAIPSADEIDYDNELSFPVAGFMPPTVAFQFKIRCQINHNDIKNDKEKVKMKLYLEDGESYAVEFFIKTDKSKIEKYLKENVALVKKK